MFKYRLICQIRRNRFFFLCACVFKIIMYFKKKNPPPPQFWGGRLSVPAFPKLWIPNHQLARVNSWLQDQLLLYLECTCVSFIIFSLLVHKFLMILSNFSRKGHHLSLKAFNGNRMKWIALNLFLKRASQYLKAWGLRLYSKQKVTVVTSEM